MRVLCLALLLACASPAMAQGDAPPPAVTVIRVTEGTVERRASFTGRVEAQRKVELRARVEGFLEGRTFEEGGAVTAGQPLFAIERGLYEAAVKEIEGSLLSAEGARKAAELERDRQQTLVQRQAAAQAALDNAEAALTEAEGRVLQLEGSLQRAQLELSYTDIQAPFAGVVGRATADVGDYVNPQSEPLATLVSVDPMTVLFPVSEAALLEARRTADADPSSVVVRITLADGTDYGAVGTIDFVDVEVAEGTDTVLVRAVLPNAEGLLIDGQFVRVRLDLDDATDLLVPLAAVQRDREGAYVLRVDEADTVAIARVELGANDGQAVTVTHGLEAGDRVITEGVNKVRDGMVVDAAEATTPTIGSDPS